MLVSKGPQIRLLSLSQGYASHLRLRELSARCLIGRVNALPEFQLTASCKTGRVRLSRDWDCGWRHSSPGSLGNIEVNSKALNTLSVLPRNLWQGRPLQWLSSAAVAPEIRRRKRSTNSLIFSRHFNTLFIARYLILVCLIFHVLVRFITFSHG